VPLFVTPRKLEVERMGRKQMVERSMTIKMKGSLKEINAFCSAVGSLSNEYELEVEFE